MSDEAVYRETIGDRKPVAYAKQRDVLYFNDSNNGSYNGQIVFESINLGGGSDKYQSWGEAMIMIPYVVTATITRNTGPVVAYTAFTGYELGLKNGYYQLIDQVKVEYNNKTVQENQSLLNHYVNFKLLTELSQEDVQKWGPTIGFVPDDADSYQRTPVITTGTLPPAAATDLGVGFMNNRDNPTPLNSFSSASYCNLGYYNRKKACTAYPSTGYGGVNTVFNNTAAGTNIGAGVTGILGTVGKNYVVGTAGNSITWVILAQIRLRDVCDFVDKLPLVKNANIRITISYNSAKFNVLKPAIAGCSGYALSTYTQLTGNTNPILLGSTYNAGGLGIDNTNDTANSFAGTSGAFGNGGVANNVATIAVDSGVCRNSTITAPPSLPFNQCRVYLPVYEMNPQFEEQILSVSPQKTIYYQDIYQFRFTVGNGSNINQIITSSQKSPVAVVAMPYPASTAIRSSTVSQLYNSTQNPFDSAPATTCPIGYIENFNILLSGKPVFTMNKSYDFEAFNDELCKYKSFNGATTNGLSNGLLGFKEFSGAYRFYFCDLSRRLDYLSDTSYSINMIGKNSSGVDLDIVVIVIYNKNAVLNLLDGTMLS